MKREEAESQHMQGMLACARESLQCASGAYEFPDDLFPAEIRDAEFLERERLRVGLFESRAQAASHIAENIEGILLRICFASYV